MGRTGLLAAVAGLIAGGAAAQQIGDTVPESALTGPAYSLDAPPQPPGRYGAEAMRAYVQVLQRMLPAHGYRCGPASGQLDPLTERAILAYQADAGLPLNARDLGALKRTLDHVAYARPGVFAGQAPPPTEAAATAPAAIHPPEDAAPEPPPAARPEPPPPDAPPPAEDTVRFVQQRLKDKGYDIAVTGTLDLYTVNAVKVFQAENNLPRDGRIDPYLLDLLKK
jgi:peptidoglycan hydrolase-like protein with peptidoglycan-binding domain